jgi:hypothetical protein
MIKSLKDDPSTTSVIAVNTDALANFWYDNPNIEYYRGRTIKTYLLDDGFPFAEYIIVEHQYSDQFVRQINDEHGFGRSVSASVDQCSKNLCLLHLVDSQTHRTGTQ